MKRLFLLVGLGLFLISSCEKEDDLALSSSGGYQPVLMNYDQLKESVYSEPPRSVGIPGKIYLYPPYIFLIERYEGIHIIDNTDPENPQNVRFINVPGINDVAVKDSVVYADNSVDLVAVKINEGGDVKELKRFPQYFYNRISPDGSIYYKAIPENFVIVNWVLQ